MRSFKILALLLAYPTSELQAHMPELKKELDREGLVRGRVRQALFDFMDDLEKGDPLDLQEAYVELFDRGRAHALHLFEHSYGEARTRGSAMVNLAEMYRDEGVELKPGELPDYLPVFLEYLSLKELAAARTLLCEPLHILVALKKKLQSRESGYATIFEALEKIANSQIDEQAVKAAMAAAGSDDQSPEALDLAWQEPAAFGGAPGACDSCGVKLAQARSAGK